MSKGMIIAVISILVIGVVGFLTTRQTTAPSSPAEVSQAPSTQTSSENQPATDSGTSQGVVLAGTSSKLYDFNKAEYDKAKASDKLVVLYFYANWCPICREEVPKLYSAFNELTTDQVIGFRINYNDTDTDVDEQNLAREFGVAYQHTKVFLKNGQRVLKSPESWEKDRYLNEINKAL